MSDMIDPKPTHEATPRGPDAIQQQSPEGEVVGGERHQRIEEDKIQDIRSRVFSLIAEEGGRSMPGSGFRRVVSHELGQEGADKRPIEAAIPEYGEYMKNRREQFPQRNLFSRRRPYQVKGKVEVAAYDGHFSDILDTSQDFPGSQTYEYVDLRVQRFSGDISIEGQEYHIDDELVIDIAYGYNFDITTPQYFLTVNTRQCEIVAREVRGSLNDKGALSDFTNEELLDKALTAAEQGRKLKQKPAR